jgi:hypothetical protein
MGNVLFSEYTKLYYGNDAVSSLYIAEGSDLNNFSIGFFVKRGKNTLSKIAMKRASWASRAAGTPSTSLISNSPQTKQPSNSIPLSSSK